MRKVTMYEAKDGLQFQTEASCLKYEQQCRDTQAANKMLENGATLMDVLTKANKSQPCWDKDLNLEDKIILRKKYQDLKKVICMIGLHLLFVE